MARIPRVFKSVLERAVYIACTALVFTPSCSLVHPASGPGGDFHDVPLDRGDGFVFDLGVAPDEDAGRFEDVITSSGDIFDAPADAPADAPVDAPTDTPVDAPMDAPVGPITVPLTPNNSCEATPSGWMRGDVGTWRYEGTTTGGGSGFRGTCSGASVATTIMHEPSPASLPRGFGA